jgi:putative cell wall-binding protein
VYGVIAGVTAFGALSGLAATAASATSNVTINTSLPGADRYATAGNVNAAANPAGFSRVLLADGIPGHQSDALAASGYAGISPADGILLTDNTNTVPANTLSALAKDDPGKNVLALGGSAAISPAQVAQLTSAGYTVTQPFQGANRFQTMQMIDDAILPSQVGTSGSPAVPTAILASGDDNHLIDALSAAGLSYADHFPVILTESSSSTLIPQAQQVITALNIQRLIVVGGTASIPASQYTPMPSGVTQLDTSATTGADRSATSELLEKDEVANYGASNTSLAIAAGATYVGSTTNIQNDGADALSSAPFTGGFMPTCVTDSPTTPGSVNQCGTDLASTLTTIYALTGPANLPASELTGVCQAAGGTSCSATPTANAYTVSGPSPSATPAASTSSNSSQGVVTYTVSGLPTASGTTANIALFPCTGQSQTGNNTVNGAPTTPSGGSTTFTAPGGTSPVAGSAVGQGTTSSNSPATTPGYSSGAVTTTNASAYIASVNGVPTANNAAGQGPTQVYGISVSGGTLTFALNSFALDCAIPVVYTAPASAGTNPPLLVNANGTPATGYAVGTGGLTFWQAPPAPSYAGTYNVNVVLAPPLSGTSSFDGFVLSCSTACPSGVSPGATTLSFTFGGGSQSYFYTDGTPEPSTTWSADLSGPVTGQYVPNTTTVYPSGTNGGKGGVWGDGVSVSGYASGTAGSFSYNAAAPAVGLTGDVPAAATSLGATFNGCAYTSGGVCQPGDVLTWTPPVNQDVSGPEATTGTTVNATTNANYQIWRSTSTTTSGTTTLGAATQVGTVWVEPSGVGVNNGAPVAATGGTTSNCSANQACTSVSSPEFIDTSMATGQAYVYYVVPVASTIGGGQDGPFSSASPTVMAGAAATTPAITAVQIVTATATPAATAGSTTTPQSFATPGTGIAIVTYNEAVSCLSAAGPDFAYSNSGGSNGSGGTTITAANCYPARSGAAGGTLSSGSASGTPTPVTGSAGTVWEYNQNTGKWVAGGMYSYNGATSDNSANTLIFAFPSAVGSACTIGGSTRTCYTGTTVAAPGNGDTATYTPPSTQTTSNSVFAGTSSSPVYEPAGTVTSNGAAGPGDPTNSAHGSQNADPPGYGSGSAAGSDPLYV